MIVAISLILLAGCAEPSTDTTQPAIEEAKDTESTLETFVENLEYGMDTWEDWGGRRTA